MDYSKHGTHKKTKNIRSGIPKAKHKVSFNIFRIFIFCLIAVAVMGISAGFGGLKGVLDSAPEISVRMLCRKAINHLFMTGMAIC